ncbi:hypothetical protein [Okeania sp. KiyG1]|uniref:hypothetical protein n=1 Tax=Okeania sp. KiyG1 TaxID=2720165 RepID=UPI001924EBEC|nr:hypothetical protein [Okeania sp. KiyG1]
MISCLDKSANKKLSPSTILSSVVLHSCYTRNKGCLAREQDAPTAVPRNKNNAMHDHYNAPPPLYLIRELSI